jgi:MYXO-CTERM domain-containing protein
VVVSAAWAGLGWLTAHRRRYRDQRST